MKDKILLVFDESYENKKINKELIGVCSTLEEAKKLTNEAKILSNPTIRHRYPIFEVYVGWRKEH